MIAFVSTYLSHHQLPFCLQMKRLTEDGFCYIACEPIHESRLQLGYEDLNQNYSFVHRAYESESAMQEAKRICDTCDVLLVGSAPEQLFLDRLRNKKLTFRICERLFKEPFTVKNVFRRSAGMLRHFLPYQNKNYYVLAASAYTANDFLKYGCFRDRLYQWGYFPEVRQYPDAGRLMEEKQKNSIVWVGRFIDWKHPETALALASRLKRERIPFHLKMIGTGEQFETIQTEIQRLGLSDFVHLTGAMPSEDVRREMENSDVFLFTSDRREGWGAVVNEAMNSGCALLANHAAGAVPFLIRDGENGYTYHDGDAENAYQKLRILLQQRDICRTMGLAAYETIIAHWNAENAANRLMNVISHIQTGEPCFYDCGICSAAVRQKT